MTIIYLTAGLGLFGVLRLYWSPANALAALLLLGSVLRMAF